MAGIGKDGRGPKERAEQRRREKANFTMRLSGDYMTATGGQWEDILYAIENPMGQISTQLARRIRELLDGMTDEEAAQWDAREGRR